MKQLKYNYSIIGLLLIVFSSVSFLLYQQIFTDHYESDTQEHIIFLYQYLYGTEFYISHPLWHYGVEVVSKILQISIEYAAIVFSAFLVTLWTYLVYTIVNKRIQTQKFYTLTIITFVIIIIGPLCIPWYNKIIYLGQGSPNIWHNVTLWAVKPFALLSVIFIIKAIQTKKNLYYILTILALIASLFAKPSFAIIFLPALAIFALIKNLKDKQFIIFYIILGTLSIAVLLYQFTHTFNSGDSKVIFDFLGVWSQASQNILLSIILALAFPLLFLLLESKVIHNDYILLSWLQIFIGIMFYAFFAQTGRFYSHGNFGWSYMIAMSLLYLFSIIKFFEIYNQLHVFKRYMLLLLLIIQVLTGIYYFVKVMQGQNPMYIAIFL